MSSKPELKLLHVPDDWLKRLAPAVMFPVEQPLEVELGSGDGSFLAHHAAEHPERNFIGVERLKGRIYKLDKLGVRMGLENLRLMRIEIGYFVQYLLPPGSVRAFHIYFPDPWPKKRHHKNRLFQDAFMPHAAAALAPGGVIYLRTDNLEYFEQMLEVGNRAAGFEPVETPAELKDRRTDFEEHFNARGVPTNYAAFRLKR